MPLHDQVILITGCSSGIGRALTEELVARGQCVIATARNVNKLANLAAHRKLALDVTDQDSIGAAVEQVLATVGRIDILINNAGLNVIGPLAELPLERARQVFDTNLLGPFAMIQAVFPTMAERGKGRIVNVGSVVGLLPTPFAAAYCASKAAVHMVSEVLRMEVEPFGISVIEVQPGAIRSSIADNGAGELHRFRSNDSRYRLAYEGIEKRARISQHKAMDTRAFASYVVDALLAEKPPRIVRSGRGATLYPALSKLPGRARDELLKRQFALSRLRRI